MEDDTLVSALWRFVAMRNQFFDPIAEEGMAPLWDAVWVA